VEQVRALEALIAEHLALHADAHGFTPCLFPVAS